MKNSLLILSILFLHSCSSQKPNTPIDGTWSLISSNDQTDEYYQLQIDDSKVQRLFTHGIQENNRILLDDGYIVFLEQYKLNLKVLSKDEIQISDEETTHTLKKIVPKPYCFCIDPYFYHRKFNFDIRQTNPTDSLRIQEIKDKMWENFNGNIDGDMNFFNL